MYYIFYFILHLFSNLLCHLPQFLSMWTKADQKNTPPKSCLNSQFLTTVVHICFCQMQNRVFFSSSSSFASFFFFFFFFFFYCRSCGFQKWLAIWPYLQHKFTCANAVLNCKIQMHPKVKPLSLSKLIFILFTKCVSNECQQFLFFSSKDQCVP